MPTAEKFTALGAGNGFPFCPTRVNVENYSYWSTLGGFNDTNTGSPTDEQLNLSLLNAMKLWWNYNGHIASSSGSAGSPSGEITINLDNGGTGDSEKYPEGLGDPMYRACYSSWGIYSSSIASQTGIDIVIVRMYNSSEFIGYGILNSIHCGANDFFNPELKLLSIGYIPEILGSPADHEVAYAKIDDIHFACLAWNDGTPGSYSMDISGNPASSPTSISASFTGQDGNPSMATLKIGDLDFYTY